MSKVGRNSFTVDDFLIVREKLRQGYGRRVRRLLRPVFEDQRTRLAWESTTSPQKHWGSLDLVQKRWNMKATGDPDRTFHDLFVKKYLSGIGNRESGIGNRD